MPIEERQPEQHDWNSFAVGWAPSEDAINGRKNCALQLDNLELDSNGALSLTGGSVSIRTLAANPHTLFNRYINNASHIYAGCIDGKVYRDGTILSSSGDSARCAFGTAFNFTLIASGNYRVKDSGSGTPVNLGVGPATAAPTVTIYKSLAPKTTLAPIGSLTYLAHFKGTVALTPYGAGYFAVQATCDSDGISVIQSISASLSPARPYDASIVTNQFSQVGNATDNDTITLIGYTPDPFGGLLRFDIILAPGDSAGNQTSDYFSYEMADLATNNANGELIRQKNVTFDSVTGVFTVKMRRGDFVRFGTGDQTWENVYGVRLTFIGNPSQQINYIGSYISANPVIDIVGGSHSQNGTYQFAQVNVNNTGSYLALSPLGPISKVVSISNTQARIVLQTPTDPQVNEIWVYARSAGGVNDLGLSSGLDKWYRVLVVTNVSVSPWVSGVVPIQVGDLEALEINITFDPRLVTAQPAGISEKFLEIIGPVNGRHYYFTPSFMYPSDQNDPDLIASFLGIRTCGSNSEIFLWARLITSGIILVGTSIDIYILTGTFNTLSDGSVDITYLPLGCKFPPMTSDCAVYSGNVFYLSSDGWRSYSYYGNNPNNISGTSSNPSGSNPLLVSPNTDLLYRGDSRYGYTAPSLTFVPGTVRYPVVIARNKLFCFIYNQTRCEVYDFIRNYWRVLITSSTPSAACAADAEDGSGVYAAFGAVIYNIDRRDSLAQTVNVLSPILDGGYLLQRKDPCAVKIRFLATGGTVSLSIITELGSYSVSTTLASASIAEVVCVPPNLTPFKQFQWKVSSSSVTNFVLESVSLTFVPRPIPFSTILIRNEDFGIVARKRILDWGFVLDTSQAVSATFTPILDNVAQAPVAISTVEKTSVPFPFTPDLIARDWGGRFSCTSGYIEFWGHLAPREVEAFPDPIRWMTIPVTNFGTATRKRLRVWSFILNTLGHDVVFTLLVYGIAQTPVTFNTADKQTVFYFATSDISGIDFSGTFSGSYLFEMWEVMKPEFVQEFTIQKKFKQLGPEDLDKSAKIKEISMRLYSNATVEKTLGYTIYFDDSTKTNGTFTIYPKQDVNYTFGEAKGTSGNILRIEIGGNIDFTFCRYDVKLRVMKSGTDSENIWVTLPRPEMQA